MEQKLRETEYLLACGALSDYPRNVLDRLWKGLRDLRTVRWMKKNHLRYESERVRP